MNKPKLRAFEFNEEKFKEAILFIAAASEEDEGFGATKLNKVLYYADFTAYRRLGEPITGATYQKLNEGPAPRELLRVRRSLIDAGYASIEHRPYFTGTQQRLKVAPQHKPEALRPKHLSPVEVSILREVLHALVGMNGREVSELSHKEVGWLATAYKETIPYETAWLSTFGDAEQELELDES